MSVRVIIRDIITLIFSSIIGSIVVFMLMRMLGGNVATVILGLDATPAAIEQLSREMGLDLPWHLQYLNWISGFFSGNLGRSYAGGIDIFDEILGRMGPTCMLAFGSLVVSFTVALPIGAYSALHAKSARGTAIDSGAQLGVAIPSFWAGLLLIYCFSVTLGWFPATGYVPFLDNPLGSLHSLVLPITALSLGSAAIKTRFVRSAFLDVMNEDYIRTAMAKGRTYNNAVVVHGIRNVSIPIITVGVLQLGSLLAGTIVIENVFVIPGLGRLLLTAVNGREVLVVQSTVFVILMIILIMNFIMDIAYGVLDPRISDRSRSS